MLPWHYFIIELYIWLHSLHLQECIHATTSDETLFGPGRHHCFCTDVELFFRYIDATNTFIRSYLELIVKNSVLRTKGIVVWSSFSSITTAITFWGASRPRATSGVFTKTLYPTETGINFLSVFCNILARTGPGIDHCGTPITVLVFRDKIPSFCTLPELELKSL